MIDVRLLRTDPHAVRAALARRGDESVLADLERAAQLDGRLREITAERDAIRAKVNDLSKRVGQARRDGDGATADALQAESRALGERIRASGAGIVFIGLGCPRQEVFAYAMRPLLDMPLMAVGAAFDYHAGLLRNPPPWMQRAGLEWFWRLGLEPKRLWRRYVILNPAYLARLAAQKTGVWKATPPPPATERPASFAV